MPQQDELPQTGRGPAQALAVLWVGGETLRPAQAIRQAPHRAAGVERRAAGRSAEVKR